MQTDIHALNGFRNHDPSVQASEDSSCLNSATKISFSTLLKCVTLLHNQHNQHTSYEVYHSEQDQIHFKLCLPSLLVKAGAVILRRLSVQRQVVVNTSIFVPGFYSRQFSMCQFSSLYLWGSRLLRSLYITFFFTSFSSASMQSSRYTY
jgi:hypothetical protein